VTNIEEKADVILAARTSLCPRCARALHVARDAHDKHHLAYVNNGNNLAKGTEWENKPVEEVVKGTFGKNQGLFNNAGQHYNHIHFWKWMKLGGGGDKIPGELEKKITADLGSVANMKEEFIQAGVTHFGSGWCWLAVEGGKIVVMKTLNGENPLVQGGKPILGSITATDGPTTSRRSSITWLIGNTWPKCTGRPRNNDQRVARHSGATPSVPTIIGSATLGHPALRTQSDGDNLLANHDEDVPTVFAIEALVLVDHFDFLDRSCRAFALVARVRRRAATDAQALKEMTCPQRFHTPPWNKLAGIGVMNPR
jgi:Iron/manganese superoxide dismutases, alpha-hairpin domain/Iron/manganese superoxide dismutases, C-terminal domain